MWDRLPTNRLRVFAIPAILAIIPLSGSFGGATHPIVCQSEIAGPFSVGGGDGTSLSAAVLEQADVTTEQVQPCDGFTLLPQLSAGPSRRTNLRLAVLNSTGTSAVASVELHVGKHRSVVRIGDVGAGGGAGRTIVVRPPTADTPISVRLLLGP